MGLTLPGPSMGSVLGHEFSPAVGLQHRYCRQSAFPTAAAASPYERQLVRLAKLVYAGRLGNGSPLHLPLEELSEQGRHSE